MGRGIRSRNAAGAAAVLVTLALVAAAAPSAAKEIFVAVGGSGNGSAGSPYGSIQQALDAAAQNDVIRIGPGIFDEAVVIRGRVGLSVIGAGIDQTRIRPDELNGFLFDQSFQIAVSDLHVENLTAHGRGFVVQASSVTLARVSTRNTNEEGILMNQWVGIGSSLVLSDSEIDESQFGPGLWVQSGSTVVATNTSFSGHGTGTCGPGCPIQFGRGVVVTGENDDVTLIDCHVDGNSDAAILVDSVDTRFVMSGGSASDNGSNGGFLRQSVSAEIRDADFSRNGPLPASFLTGRNGLELYSEFTGSAIVERCTFLDNTLNGIFAGNGSLLVRDSTFAGNLVAITASDVMDKAPFVEIHGNQISTDYPNQDPVPTAIFLDGPAVTARVGALGDPADANRIENARPFGAIQCDRGPTVCLGQNEFVNAPNPLGACVHEPLACPEPAAAALGAGALAALGLARGRRRRRTAG